MPFKMNVTFLGLETDEHMNWKTHIEFMLPKLIRVCYVIRYLKHYSTTETLTIAYFVYFHSAMMCGIIFWANSIDSNKVFLQQKRTVRTKLGINPLSKCKPYFKTLGIMTLPSQYILSLMEFLINNFGTFFS